jgi:hypothetical protein
VDVCKAIETVKSSKSVGLDIPGFVVKGCSAVSIPILRHVFNLNPTQQCFPAVWKEAAIVPVCKRGNDASARNYRLISILNNFSKLLEFIIYDHVSHYVKLNPNQHGFTKSKSTVTNFITFLKFMTPIVRSHQADAVYFDISNPFDLVPHNLLLHKLSSFGFSDGYVSWFRSYLSKRHFWVRISGTFSLHFKVTSVCRKALSWCLFFLTYSLMTY